MSWRAYSCICWELGDVAHNCVNNEGKEHCMLVQSRPISGEGGSTDLERSVRMFACIVDELSGVVFGKESND